MLTCKALLKGFFAAWREVRPIFLFLAGLLSGGLLLGRRGRWLALLAGAVLGWVAYFFRDPERSPASTDPRAILSPADGRVLSVERLEDAGCFPGPAQRIIIFLSLFDVHNQRTPYPARVQHVEYQPGAFAPAYQPDAQANEANLLLLETAHGLLALRQVAGILARKIVCWARPGDELARGQRFGLIKFGSRVDLFLPPNAEVLVHKGQQVYGGQTFVARWIDDRSPQAG